MQVVFTGLASTLKSETSDRTAEFDACKVQTLKTDFPTYLQESRNPGLPQKRAICCIPARK